VWGIQLRNQDPEMTFNSEILFVDPFVSDVPTILSGLRPEVEAIVLDSYGPAARQMAAALRGRRDLDAVHIIAHGAPGRVIFTSGEWSSSTILSYSGDLAAIGRALREEGELRLWSCDVAIGAAGATFIEALTEVAGAYVAAADRRVGSPALGGTWKLKGRPQQAISRPPLNAAATLGYSQVLTDSITLTSDSFVSIRGNFGGKGVVLGSLYYFVIQGGSGDVTVVGQITAQKFSKNGIFSYSLILPAGTYSVGRAGKSLSSAFNLYVVDTGGSESSGGAASITSTLSAVVGPAATGARGSGVHLA
jgi:hypothetical protein